MSGTIYAKAYTSSPTKGQLSGNYNSYMKKLSGPELAEHIFNINVPEPYEDNDRKDQDYFDYLTNTTDEDIGYQFELKLENPNEILSKYKNSIEKYDRAYKKMSNYALQWYLLQEDVGNNGQIEKMYKDLQMMRRLYER
jgi:hypothetical protein